MDRQVVMRSQVIFHAAKQDIMPQRLDTDWVQIAVFELDGETNSLRGHTNSTTTWVGGAQGRPGKALEATIYLAMSLFCLGLAASRKARRVEVSLLQHSSRSACVLSCFQWHGGGGKIT
jgi:hypothetical protein